MPPKKPIIFTPATIKKEVEATIAISSDSDELGYKTHKSVWSNIHTSDNPSNSSPKNSTYTMNGTVRVSRDINVCKDVDVSSTTTQNVAPASQNQQSYQNPMHPNTSHRQQNRSHSNAQMPQNQNNSSYDAYENQEPLTSQIQHQYTNTSNSQQKSTNVRPGTELSSPPVPISRNVLSQEVTLTGSRSMEIQMPNQLILTINQAPSAQINQPAHSNPLPNSVLSRAPSEQHRTLDDHNVSAHTSDSISKIIDQVCNQGNTVHSNGTVQELTSHTQGSDESLLIQTDRHPCTNHRSVRITNHPSTSSKEHNKTSTSSKELSDKNRKSADKRNVRQRKSKKRDRHSSRSRDRRSRRRRRERSSSATSDKSTSRERSPDNHSPVHRRSRYSDERKKTRDSASNSPVKKERYRRRDSSRSRRPKAHYSNERVHSDKPSTQRQTSSFRNSDRSRNIAKSSNNSDNSRKEKNKMPIKLEKLSESENSSNSHTSDSDSSDFSDSSSSPDVMVVVNDANTLKEMLQEREIKGYDYIDGSGFIPECNVCERYKEAWSIEGLKRHMMDKHDMMGAFYRCFVCGFDSAVGTTLRKHIKSMHHVDVATRLIYLLNVTVNPFRGTIPTCSTCSYQSHSKRYREAHKCQTSFVPLLPVKKGRCSDFNLKRIGSESQLIRYIGMSDVPGLLKDDVKQIGQTYSQYECTFCNSMKIYERLWNLCQHLRLDHEMSCILFRCFICHHESKTAKEIAIHVRQAHDILSKRVFLTNLGVYVDPYGIARPMQICDRCGIECLRKESLRRHKCHRAKMSMKKFQQEMRALKLNEGASARTKDKSDGKVRDKDDKSSESTMPQNEVSHSNDINYAKHLSSVGNDVNNDQSKSHSTQSRIHTTANQYNTQSTRDLQNQVLKQQNLNARENQASSDDDIEITSYIPGSSNSGPVRIKTEPVTSASYGQPIKTEVTRDSEQNSYMTLNLEMDTFDPSSFMIFNEPGETLKQEDSERPGSNQVNVFAPKPGPSNHDANIPSVKGMQTGSKYTFSDISDDERDLDNSSVAMKTETNTRDVDAARAEGNAKRISRRQITESVLSSAYAKHIDMSFASRLELEVATKKSKRTETCVLCKHTYSARDLLEHVWRRHRVHVTVYRCLVCGQDCMPRRGHMRAHMRTHDVIVDKKATELLQVLVAPYERIPVCELCGFTSASEELMLGHECKSRVK